MGKGWDRLLTELPGPFLEHAHFAASFLPSLPGPVHSAVLEDKKTAPAGRVLGFTPCQEICTFSGGFWNQKPPDTQRIHLSWYKCGPQKTDFQLLWCSEPLGSSHRAEKSSGLHSIPSLGAPPTLPMSVRQMNDWWVDPPVFPAVLFCFLQFSGMGMYFSSELEKRVERNLHPRTRSCGVSVSQDRSLGPCSGREQFQGHIKKKKTISNHFLVSFFIAVYVTNFVSTSEYFSSPCTQHSRDTLYKSSFHQPDVN